MNSVPVSDNQVAEIVKVLNGGITFYQDSKRKVCSEHLQAMFNRMIEEKELAVIALRKYMTATQQADTVQYTDWTIGIRKLYTELMESVNSANDCMYVKQLEQVENKVLDVIDTALDDSQPQAFACELRRIRTRMQQCHDEIRSLHQVSA